MSPMQADTPKVAPTAQTMLSHDPNWTFKAAGFYVPKIAEKCFEKYGFHMAAILLNWREIVGGTMAGYTMPWRIRWAKRSDRPAGAGDAKAASPQRSSLDLWVDGGRAHEIPYVGRQIIERINTYFGYRAITEIRPISGPVAGAGHAAPAVARGPTAKQVDAARAELAPLIADVGLREALARMQSNIAAKAARQHQASSSPRGSNG